MYLFILKCICLVWNVFVQFEMYLFMFKMYLFILKCICLVWNVFELVRQQTVGLGWEDPPRDCEQTICFTILTFQHFTIFNVSLF